MMKLNFKRWRVRSRKVILCWAIGFCFAAGSAWADDFDALIYGWASFFTGGTNLNAADPNRLTHGAFLELILQDELNVRQERLFPRRTKAADFHTLKPLEDFDWSFNPSVHKREIFDLASGKFIHKAEDVLFLGPPGVGKTHLAQAIGYEAIKMNFQVLYRSIFDLVRDFLKDEAFSQQERPVRKHLKPDLVIIDDMGLKQLPKHSANTCWKSSCAVTKAGRI